MHPGTVNLLDSSYNLYVRYSPCCPLENFIYNCLAFLILLFAQLCFRYLLCKFKDIFRKSFALFYLSEIGRKNVISLNFEFKYFTIKS